ncbi:hypothetical protein MRX96_031822 [Rhipicephalus microplus]
MLVSKFTLMVYQKPDSHDSISEANHQPIDSKANFHAEANCQETDSETNFYHTAIYRKAVYHAKDHTAYYKANLYHTTDYTAHYKDNYYHTTHHADHYKDIDSEANFHAEADCQETDSETNIYDTVIYRKAVYHAKDHTAYCKANLYHTTDYTAHYRNNYYHTTHHEDHYKDNYYHATDHTADYKANYHHTTHHADDYKANYHHTTHHADDYKDNYHATDHTADYQANYYHKTDNKTDYQANYYHKTDNTTDYNNPGYHHTSTSSSGNFFEDFKERAPFEKLGEIRRDGVRHFGLLSLYREHAKPAVMTEALTILKELHLYLKPNLTRRRPSYFVIGMNMEDPARGEDFGIDETRSHLLGRRVDASELKPKDDDIETVQAPVPKSQVKFWIKKGWPKILPEEQSRFRPYSSKKAELPYHQDLVYWGHHIVLPTALN